MSVNIYDLGDDPDFVRNLATDLMQSLSEPFFDCRLCEFHTKSGSIADMLDELGRHGVEAHPEVYEDREEGL